MRKTFLSIMAVTATVAMLHAEGYQLNLNSAKQGGMGNTGVALRLGSEGMIYNPASLSFIKGKVDLAAGVTGVRSYLNYTNGNYEAKTDNPLGTPLYLYAGLKITNNLAAGVSVNNPAGNSITWADNWRGNEIVQQSSLQAFSIQPSLSFKFLDDKLSIGAGAMILLGNFSTSKALVGYSKLLQMSAAAGMLAPPLKPIFDQNMDAVPYSATLSGNAKTGIGFNVGLLFSPIPQLSIGLSYRSKVDLKVDDGKTEITPSTNSALMNAVNTIMAAGGQSIPPLDKYTFAASMPIPSNINVGAAYHFGEKGVITAELQFVGWGAFEQLELNYEAINYKAVVPKNFSNTVIYRLGGQFAVLPNFDVRLGVYYDTTPVDKDKYYSPETPGSNKLALTCGWSWRPVKAFSVDFAFVYSHGGKTVGNYTGDPYTANAPFTGEYKVHAFLPSLGLSYTF